MKVEVRAKAFEDAINGLKGTANVSFDGCFAVHNISIIESKEGKLFVSMPSYKTKQVDEDGNSVYRDICNPVTKDFREKLYDAVLKSYETHEPVTLEYEYRDPQKLIADTIDKLEERGEFPFPKNKSSRDVRESCMSR